MQTGWAVDYGKAVMRDHDGDLDHAHIEPDDADRPRCEYFLMSTCPDVSNGRLTRQTPRGTGRSSAAGPGWQLFPNVITPGHASVGRPGAGDLRDRFCSQKTAPSTSGRTGHASIFVIQPRHTRRALGSSNLFLA